MIFVSIVVKTTKYFKSNTTATNYFTTFLQTIDVTNSYSYFKSIIIIIIIINK